MADSIVGHVLLLAGQVRRQRWLLDAVLVTSLGLCCSSGCRADSIVGHLMLLAGVPRPAPVNGKFQDGGQGTGNQLKP